MPFLPCWLLLLPGRTTWVNGCTTVEQRYCDVNRICAERSLAFSTVSTTSGICLKTYPSNIGTWAFVFSFCPVLRGTTYRTDKELLEGYTETVLRGIAINSIKQDFSRWMGRGAWALADRGLFASSNFVLNILLARWLSPQEYGGFSIIYSIFLLFGTLHDALLIEPMLVFGPSKYKVRFSAYLGMLNWAHWSFTAIIGMFFVLVTLALWIFSNSILIPATLGFAIASPFILFQWLMRSACYINLQPKIAASAGVPYMVLMLVGTYVLYHNGWLSPATAFSIMAFASIVSGLWCTYRLKMTSASASTRASLRMGELLGDHWRYGRWSVLAAAVNWLPGNVYFLLLPIALGVEASGALRALLNLVVPISHFTAALTPLILSTLARAKSNAQQFRKSLTVAFLTLGGATICYWLLLVFAGNTILRTLYADQYSSYAHLLILAGLLPFLSSIGAVLAVALKAVEAPKLVFWSYLGAALSTVTLGLWVMFSLGVSGAILGNLISSLVMVSILIYFVHRKMRRIPVTDSVKPN